MMSHSTVVADSAPKSILNHQPSDLFTDIPEPDSDGVRGGLQASIASGEIPIDTNAIGLLGIPVVGSYSDPGLDSDVQSTDLRSTIERIIALGLLGGPRR